MLKFYSKKTPMNFKIIILFILTAISSIQAQIAVKPALKSSPGIILGKIVDKNSKEPLPYVNIVVKDDAKIIDGGITTDQGNFVIKNLELKKYTVEIQFIGYKTIIRIVTLSNENKTVNLNTVSLQEDATQLSEVDIVKEQSIIEQKIDRKVINVGKDLLSAGATASEILNNIPSVSVDPQTNAVSLRGNSNVRILIDGKPSTIEASQLLQQIPATSIKQIELITNPSAKYNPEGMSGMINIILNKNSKIGFNGSVNSGVTFGITPKSNSSFDMNYRNGKINVYGNYGLNAGKYTNHGFVRVTEPNEENYQLFNSTNENISHLLKVGFDFYLNDTNTFSIYTTQNISNGIGHSRNSVDFQDPLKSDVLQLLDDEKGNHTQTYNFNYKKKFKKEGQNIEFEANYTTNEDTEDAAFSTPSTNYITNNGKNTLLNLDYVDPISKTAKLELGLETRIENTKNNFLLNNAYNSDFEYSRNIYSAYATYSKQWGKWSAQAGARLEKYNADALFKKVNETNATFKDDLFTVYPSGYLNYAPNDKNSFNLSVSKRVDRPSIGQVNPIREWSTPQVDSQGNPNLFPQFTNSVELNYTRKTKIGSLTTAFFYRNINDEITRTVIVSPTDPEKVILSYENLNDNNAFGFEISGNLDFTKWWSANVSADVYNKKAKGVVGGDYLEVDVTQFNTRFSNTFKPTKKLRLQLSSMYRGKDLGLQFLRQPMWKIDMGASYTILKGSGTITSRFNDVFNTMNFAFNGSKPRLANGQFNWESQTAYIGFNYRFGTGKNKALNRKQRDKNETQGSSGF